MNLESVEYAKWYYNYYLKYFEWYMQYYVTIYNFQNEITRRKRTAAAAALLISERSYKKKNVGLHLFLH